MVRLLALLSLLTTLPCPAQQEADAAGDATALQAIALTHLDTGNLEEAARYFRQFVAHAGADRAEVATAYNHLGNIHNETGEYTRAMEAYTEAARINTEIGSERNAGVNMANIGMIHQKINNPERALDYYRRSDSIFRKLDFPLGLAFVYKSMGIVYRSQGQFDDALANYRLALDLYSELDRQRELCQVYQNMGNVYSDQGQSAAAITHYRQSLGMAVAQSDSLNMALVSQSLGREFFYLKQLDSAVAYSRTAVQLAELTGANLTAMDGYENLSEAYHARSDFKRAYDYRLRYEALRDSLYTIEKRDLAGEIEAKYQNEQKTREIALLASEKELQALQLNKRKNERNGIIVLSAFMLLLAGLAYNQYRIKKRGNQELRELDRIKSNFFANISHEFRTPLTLIKGPVDKLASQPGKKLEPGEIDMIRRNTHKVLGLVNQLLDLSRIDQGKLDLHLAEGDIHECLKTAAASFDSHAAQHRMDYQVKVPDSPLIASFDREKVDQVVYNLLGNAFKFSEEHGRIVLSAAHERDMLRLEVIDSGQGIPSEHIPFIFDRFYQVDSGIMRDQEGSGIGLSLTKDLVELMGGTIDVSSKVGDGTRFTVMLPMKPVAGAGVPATPATAASERVSPVGQEARLSPEVPDALYRSRPDDRDLPVILLIEDNSDMRQFIKGGLLDAYRILEAENGETGLKMATAKLPDLIITDLMMPKMDGIRLCRELKDKLETSHIPIVMLTARAGIENKLDGLETGADDYLTKPFVAEELRVRVRNLLQQRQRLKEYYRKNEYSLSPENISATSLDKRLLQKVLDLLEARHADPEFDVAQMQRELAMSKTQLNRKLKALTDESPRDILRNYRLKRAAQLLAQQSDTVTQIAYQVGFNNLSYFAKCFRKQYGVAPSSY